MRAVDTPSGLVRASALALALALLALSVTPSGVAQPRESVHEVRPREGSVARGVLEAPRWVTVGGGAAIAAAAVALLARRAARRGGGPHE